MGLISYIQAIQVPYYEISQYIRVEWVETRDVPHRGEGENEFSLARLLKYNIILDFNVCKCFTYT